jgi:hypothetical protein
MAVSELMVAVEVCKMIQDEVLHMCFIGSSLVAEYQARCQEKLNAL